MEKKIMVIDNQKDMKKLSKKLGVREDWHEPDESGVEAVVRGKTFDNAGFWGSAFEKSNAKSDTKCACEKYVQIRQYGEPVAEVNLATLCAIAAGTMDEDLDEKLEKIKLRRWYRGEIQIQGKDVKFNWGPVKNIHTVGEYDIIAKIEAEDFEKLGEIVINNIRSIKGVIDTKTLTGTRL